MRTTEPRSDVRKCYYCDTPGHFIKDCRKKQNAQQGYMHQLGKKTWDSKAKKQFSNRLELFSMEIEDVEDLSVLEPNEMDDLMMRLYKMESSPEEAEECDGQKGHDDKEVDHSDTIASHHEAGQGEEALDLEGDSRTQETFE